MPVTVPVTFQVGLPPTDRGTAEVMVGGRMEPLAPPTSRIGRPPLVVNRFPIIVTLVAAVTRIPSPALLEIVFSSPVGTAIEGARPIVTLLVRVPDTAIPLPVFPSIRLPEIVMNLVVPVTAG